MRIISYEGVEMSICEWRKDKCMGVSDGSSYAVT